MTIEEARASNPVAAYLVSKTLAEKAAFDFVEKEKPGFSITTLCPPMVHGPLAQDFDDMSKLNTSSGAIWHLINGEAKEVPATGFFSYVDVRDRKLHIYMQYHRNHALWVVN